MSTLQDYLGYARNDRVLIIHADDIGMCEATVSAWRALQGSNLTSASAMAPCPWFHAAVDAVRAAGPAADMGLHLTLNCEWPNYRWRALTGPAHPARLCRADGTLHQLAADTYRESDLAAARDELEAQIALARQLGLPLTHLDSHMLTIWHPALLTHMLALGKQYALPLLLPRINTPGMMQAACLPEPEAAAACALLDAAIARGELLPLTGMAVLPLHSHITLAERLAWVAEELARFDGPGVYCLIGHPASNTPELQAIARDWRGRVADFELMASAALRDLVAGMGFKTSGFRPKAATTTAEEAAEGVDYVAQ
ncbi:ChbG/HpnK family deacetylase [Chitinilyticum litopenaei]|uniref:ChbG/HpnK family deacetylase n=1 Tax=Chitinilyticum litopenaei TaxID=1121276 RepID=UPI00040E4633|nr:ChbG/HpnK family deacetylase [Chitinilyticum litopenaei]